MISEVILPLEAVFTPAAAPRIRAVEDLALLGEFMGGEVFGVDVTFEVICPGADMLAGRVKTAVFLIAATVPAIAAAAITGLGVPAISG